MVHNWHLQEAFRFENRMIRYNIRGTGPPLVMVHGTPWSSFNFRHLINSLSEQFTIYYYDLLGYGQSDQSEGDVSLGIQNRALRELLDHWKLKQPFIIGHDFGGATVLRSHLLDSCEFRKIVLIDPVAISPWGSPFFRHVQKHRGAFDDIPDFIHKAIVRSYVQTAAYEPIKPDLLNSIIKPWTGPAGKRAFYRQIAQADSAFTKEVEPFYKDIVTPVMLLWGQKDQWIPIEQAYTLHEKIPGSELEIIPDAGHLVIEEQPGELLKHIRAFIS